MEIIMRQGYAASSFYRSRDENDDLAASLMLDNATWVALGKPEQIVVTVNADEPPGSPTLYNRETGQLV